MMLSGTSSPKYIGDVITTLIRRELGIRYKGSILGILWAILNPLGTVLVMYILFTQVLPLNIPNYAAYVYSGLLPWTWFQTTVQSGASTLIDNRDLVRKPFFPKLLLPVIVTGTNFFLYLLALPVLLLLNLAYGLTPSPALLLLPIVWLVQGVFTLAFTTLCAALVVVVRDVQHLLGVIMLLWFYLTPIFYDTSRIPATSAQWFALNPLTGIVQAYRAITLYGTLPDWQSLAGTLVLGLVLLALSTAFFRTLEDAFVDEV